MEHDSNRQGLGEQSTRLARRMLYGSHLPYRFGIVPCALVAPLGGCHYSELYPLSDVEARVRVLEEIPLGTNREDARAKLDELGADHRNEVWQGDPPKAASTVWATFDSKVFLAWTKRVVSLNFNEDASLQSVKVTKVSLYCFP